SVRPEPGSNSPTKTLTKTGHNTTGSHHSRTNNLAQKRQTKIARHTVEFSKDTRTTITSHQTGSRRRIALTPPL
ncbi:hypothetical protein, partial [Pseudonocardia ammonioxydans]|uniref:hypothetical protein n=1 Tax=Pseudonocardia ammonioxydans TaxID=260086 RepID=UPI001C436657